MAPPPPKKKPREDLAKALAAASQWHFSTKNLSASNRKAAERNYLYVKKRIRETGGDLSPAEKTMAKTFRAERAKAPPPRPRLGDISDRASVVQRKNLARGAAKTGGMGQAERKRIHDAFTRPESYPGRRSDAIIKELKKQGFPEPKTEAQAHAQVNQLMKSFDASERAALKEARKHPLRVGWNAPLIGRDAAEQMAITNARNMAISKLPKPGLKQTWAGEVGGFLDYITPERAERPAKFVGKETSQAGWAAVPEGLKPALRPIVKDVKNLTAGAAMAVPAIAETIYNDFAGNTRWGTAKLVEEMGKGWAQGVERAVPYAIPEHPVAYAKAVARGDYGAVRKMSQRDARRALKEWTTQPATATLNVYPLASGAARLATFPAIARNIARENPSFTKTEVLRAARKESYVPGYGAKKYARTGGEEGWKGGIPDRLLSTNIIDPATGKVIREGEPVAARPPSRSALGRGIQGQYDKWSRGETAQIIAPGKIPGTKRFSELNRAARAIQRSDALRLDMQATKLNQQIAPLEKFLRQSGLGAKTKNALLVRVGENRARMAEVFYGAQGPSKVDAVDTLRAVAADLSAIAREGGQKGGIATNKLGKIDKKIRNINRKLERFGTPIRLDEGAWAQATNVMREAGYSQPLIESYQAIMSHIAQVWARREPGRDPNDWITSPEGRNLAGFEFGAPPPEALSQSLFQVLYPGDADVPPDPNNRYRANRAAQAADPDIKLEDLPEPLPFRTDIEWGKGGEEAGRMAMTHSRRHAEAQALLHEVWDFENNRPLDGADPKKVAEVEKLLPEEGRWVTDREGNEVWVGRTSLQQKNDRMVRFMETLDKDQQELFRRWYERTWDYISYLYGPEKMKKMGNAFYASQAAQSPAGGIAMLFRVAEDIAAGKPMPTGKNQWLQRNVWKLMTDQDLGTNPSGLAAKLMDFFASGAGINMRALFGAMKEFGPGVVDRWTWRSDGYITKTEKGEMMSSRVPGVKASEHLGSAKGKAVAYEYSNIRLQKLTDLWNAERRFDRDDWTVDQIQAIDWFATKKEWVDNKWTPVTAEGGSPLDMVIHNTREVSFKGDPETLRRVVEEAGEGVTMLRGTVKSREPVELKGWESRIPVLINRETGEIRIGKLGESHPDILGGGVGAKVEILDGTWRQEQIIVDAKTGEVVYHPRAIPEADAQARADADIKEGYPGGIGEEARVPGETSVSPTGWTHAIIAGSAKGLDNLELSLGRQGNAYFTKYPGQFGGTASKRNHMIDVPRGRRGDAVEALQKAGIKPKDNPHVLEWGEDSYRIIFGSGTRAKKRADAVGEVLELPVESRTLTKRGRGVRPTVLQQRNAEGLAGAVQYLDTTSGKQLMYLSEHANPSTFFHELVGHAVHEMKRELPAEFAKLEKRYGKPLEEWTDVEHERFAREAERYLMTGKAPVPELQPVFDQMRMWMRAVYETIKALGRPIKPETKTLLDRYFGKEPLDFVPPKRLRRGLPDPGDVGAIGSLVDDTHAMLLRGADVLRGDAADMKRIAGNMKWLEQQVLPYVKDLDPALADRVHDLFNEFEEVKSGSSMFSADERRLLIQRGRAMTERQAQLEKMADALNAQPDAKLMEDARQVMDDLDEAETLEDQAEVLKEFKAVGGEIGKRTKGDFERQRLLERQVKDLERAIDLEGKRPGKTKAQRDEAIGIVKEMSGQMTDMFLQVFGEGLSPEALENLRRTLQVRDDLIPTRLRELGLLDEGTGHGAYVPHRSIYDKLFFTLRGPVRLPAAGGNRKILSTQVRQGAETFGKGKNKLIRYGTGELMTDPRALVSAFRNRLRFLETAMLRKRLYDMGAEIPIDPDTQKPRIPEGWYIINDSGDTVPQELKDFQSKSQAEIDELLASGEDFESMLHSDKGTMELLNDYKEKWLTDSEKKAMAWEVDVEKMRILPPEVVETMVGKVFESAPGGVPGAIGGILSVGGRVATIFSHPMGYIHANVAANAMLLALTNPTRMPRAINEFFKGPVSLRRSDPRTYQDIATLTGDVQADAGLPSFYVKEQTGLENFERTATRGARNWATYLGDVADQPFRVASWTGHARKYGYNTPEQWRELIDATDTDSVRTREIISQRAREDMLDFNKLSPFEQRAARVLFIWPFIRASVAQPLWMLREYPGRLAAVNQVAAAQERVYQEQGLESVKSRYDKIAPAEERSMYDISEVPIGGGSMNLGPVNPFGAAAEKFVAGAGVIQNPSDLRAIGELINPAYSSIGEGIFGREMNWMNAAKSTIPFASYAAALMDPKHRGAQKYTDRNSFLDYLRRRELRFSTEDVDAEKIREAGKKEADRLDTRPTWEKAEEKDDKDVEKILAHIRKEGGDVGPKSEAKIKKSVEYYHKLDQAEDAMKDRLGITGELTELQKLEATMVVAREFDPSLTRLPSVEEMSRKTPKEQKKLRYLLRDAIQYWRSEFFSTGREMKVIE